MQAFRGAFRASNEVHLGYWAVCGGAVFHHDGNIHRAVRNVRIHGDSCVTVATGMHHTIGRTGTYSCCCYSFRRCVVQAFLKLHCVHVLCGVLPYLR